MRSKLAILILTFLATINTTTAQKNEYSKLIVGKWQSMDDPNAIETYTSKELISEYRNKVVSRSAYRISYDEGSKGYLMSHMDGTDADALVFSIQKLDNNRLEMIYLAKGKTVRYKRVGAMDPKLEGGMTVVVAKAFFHATPNPKTKKKTYLVKGQKVKVSKVQGSFVFGSYTSEKGTTTTGWLKKSDVK
jgi:hypothetical protein